MDAVKQFNQELSSLYEIKPPISKAKMTAITKGAIRAIKYYKHVVQSVEKFIQKCRPEYKIPGLYVIDSIVRQSRHQFGADKDVFATRFAKNIRLTFYNLYKCTEEEKSKVIRVLNLWQKNEVFASEVIQPLFDLANPNSELAKQMDEQSKRGLLGGDGPSDSKPVKTAKIQVAAETQMQNRQQPEDQVRRRARRRSGLDPGPESIFGGGMATPPEMDQQVIQQLQTIQQLLKNHVPSDQVKFNKKLLDFDYSDDEEGGNDGPDGRPTAAMLDMLQSVLSSEQLLRKLKSMGEITDHQIQQLQQLIPQFQAQQQQQQPNVTQQQQPFIRVSPQVASIFNPQQQHNMMGQQDPGQMQVFGQFAPPGYPMGDPNQGMAMWGAPNQPLIIDDIAEDDIQILEDRSNAASNWRRDSGRIGAKTSRSRSGSRERRRGGRSRRSRSKSRDRSGRRRRSRSPRDRKESERDKEKEREKKREREKKGLPPIKKNCLSVCSTTLWVGHLSKLVGDEDLSDMFGEFGAIDSINLIPPRGCAFICMNRRQDASKALKELNRTKMHGKPITIAWAPGKCMKEKQWKDYWDVELGVSYIPIEKLDPQVNMVLLEEGGMFDEETMPEWMKSMRGVALSGATHTQQFMSQEMDRLPGPPPGFVRIPEGMSPAMGGQEVANQISVPGVHPPGMPFGLPHTGLIPGGTVLHGQAGLLGAPGGPRLVAPPGILLPRFGLGHQPPPLAGHPPPGFPPGFDISLPPPGIRPPFQHLGAPAVVSDAGSDDMDIDHEVSAAPAQSLITRERNRSGERDRNDRHRGDRNRESRWNRDDKTPSKPNDFDKSDVGPPRRDDGLLSRLRNLAGHEHAGPIDAARNKPDIWEGGQGPNREHGERGGPPPPFGTPGGPPFGAPGGPPRFGAHTQGRFPADDHAPGFNGPPGGPGGFRNGPPPFPNGGPSFRDGPPPPFGVDNEGGGGPSFGGQDFGMRGGRGSFWRGARGGRGGPPVGRGGFRDRGVWMDEGAPGGPDGFEGFPPSNERDGGWPDGGGRGGRGSWRGGNGFERGGPEPFDRNNRGDFDRDRDRRGRDRSGRDNDGEGGRDRSFEDRDRNSRERDGRRGGRDGEEEHRGADEGRGNGRARDSRRERKSRWGEEEDANSQNQPETEKVEEPTEQPPQQTHENVVPDVEKENQVESDLPSHQQQENETESPPPHQEQQKEVVEPHRDSNGEQEHTETHAEPTSHFESEPMNEEPSYEPEESTDSRFEHETSRSPGNDLDRQQPSQEPESPYDSESQQESESRFNCNESSQHQPDSPFENDQQNSRHETDFDNESQQDESTESHRHHHFESKPDTEDDSARQGQIGFENDPEEFSADQPQHQTYHDDRHPAAIASHSECSEDVTTPVPTFQDDSSAPVFDTEESHERFEDSREQPEQAEVTDNQLYRDDDSCDVTDVMTSRDSGQDEVVATEEPTNE